MKSNKIRKILFVLIAVLALLVGAGTYYLVKTSVMLSKINMNSSESAVPPHRVDVIRDSFNVYITGIDQWAKEKGYDLERSDINMIATVCPKSRTILLTSIPRDSYIALHRTGTMDKLTHTGIYGVDETLNTVQDWTGLDLNYYVKMNFTACVNIIDAIGGVDVYSPVAFGSSISDYTYKKGWNHLDGRPALYFARERKSFYEEQDQIRVQNQQRVIKAMLDKIMSSRTLLTKYGKLMDAISEDMETNMPTEDMRALIKLQLSDLSAWNVKTQRMTGKYKMATVASMNSKNKYLVLEIKDKTLKTCISQIDRTMNPSKKEIAKATADRGKNSARAVFKGVFK